MKIFTVKKLKKFIKGIINFERGIKFRMIQLMRIGDKLERIARGFAWGTFLAIWPSMPFNTLLAILCAPLFGGNRIAALIGSWLIGPFIISPVYYYLSYLTGKFLFELLGIKVEYISFSKIKNYLYSFTENTWDNTLHYFFTFKGLNQLWHKIDGFFWAMEIGGVILGIIGAYISYKSVRYIEIWFVEHKKKIFGRLKEKIEQKRKQKNGTIDN